jgi:5-methyltetrahydropteroyltriglutamate--homocysteine methyltransferase
MRPLLTHEVGSLAKPGWRVKGYAGSKLSEKEVEEARTWGECLSVPGHEKLLDLLLRSPLDAAGKEDLRRWSSHYGVRLLESAGLELVYDGEQQRSEMYAWAVAHTEGFEFKGSVRSFDNKYYSKAAVTGPISVKTPYHTREFDFVASVAKSPLKIPVTGAYTIADWSFDNNYLREGDVIGSSAGRGARRAARRRFILDVARRMVRPNLEDLIAHGARWIQIDEPAASTKPHELDLFVESFNASVEGLDCVFSTHLCFSDYNLFFPALQGMPLCRQYAVGFANEDSRAPGVSDAERPGYAIIKRFRDLPYKPALGLGVLDIHVDFIEPPELVRDRILYAVKVFGDPHRIHVTPDCGLRTRSWDVAYRKLRNMVEGVRLARRQLGI